MKQADLVKTLKKHGWTFLRHGSNHDIYTDGTHNISVPRHREIKERTAKIILEEAGVI